MSEFVGKGLGAKSKDGPRSVDGSRKLLSNMLEVEALEVVCVVGVPTAGLARDISPNKRSMILQ